MHFLFLKSKSKRLISAAFSGDVVIIRRFIEQGVDINAGDKDGMTALHGAAGRSQLNAMRVLLEAGADVDARDREGFTPLMAAATMGRVDAMRVLLKFGADMDARSIKGYAAVNAATATGEAGAVEFLLSRGARTDARAEGATAVACVAHDGRADILEMLLKYGADVEGTNERGWTALMLACTHCHVEAVRLLVANGANVNVSRQGLTPWLISAVQERAVRLNVWPAMEIQKILRDAGAQIIESEDELQAKLKKITTK